MGWGEKAIEIRSVETGHLDGVFMHKRAQRLKFLCERNDKVTPPLVNVQFVSKRSLLKFSNESVFGSQVFFASVRQGGASQVYFMTLGRSSLMSW